MVIGSLRSNASSAVSANDVLIIDKMPAAEKNHLNTQVVYFTVDFTSLGILILKVVFSNYVITS